MSAQRPRPSWAMRRCGFCEGYAQSECQSFDNVNDKICGAPLCSGHLRRRANLTLCPVHAHGAPAVADPGKAEQTAFDFSISERALNLSEGSTPADDSMDASRSRGARQSQSESIRKGGIGSNDLKADDI